MGNPNKSEKLFLNLGYNRFYDLYDEVISEEFWMKDDWYRFSKVSQIFSIYSELLLYEPLKVVIDKLKRIRPPMESEIGSLLFKFIRNVIIHFPFYNSWNDIWISKELVNWVNKGMSIDRFLTKYSGTGEVKYRFWEPDKKLMTYLSIKFPNKYENSRIYLNKIISEKDGVKFSLIIMKNILDTQVESIEEKA